jgi:lipoprotein-releasing system ATP-binding protein
VYQFHHLLGEFTAIENVAMPLMIGGINKTEAQHKSKKMLAKMGLADRIHHKPSALSGGERQRTAIARALVFQPACVLMDEPTGNLDYFSAEAVLNTISHLSVEFGTSFVVVTHESRVASKMDRILSLEHGVLLEKDKANTSL